MRGKGSHIWDADENELIDYIGSWGPLILGHAEPNVLDAIVGAACNGTSFGACATPSEADLAELVLGAFPHMQKVRFVSSGTEATMSAIRLARAYTKLSSAGVFSGTAVNSGTTFAVGSTVSANILDTSQLASSASGYGRDIGIGEDLELVVMVTTLFTSSNAGTLQVQLQYAPDSSGSPGSFVTVAQSIAYAMAALTAGAELLRIKMPPMTPNPVTGSALPKFIQMNYVVGAYNITAGAGSQLLSCSTKRRLVRSWLIKAAIATNIFRRQVMGAG